MTLKSELRRVLAQEDINFLLTNRIPRRLVTRFVGWFSQIEHPFVCKLSLRAWRLFSDLDLGEAKKPSFRSLHDCFIRELRDGVRPIDPDPGVLVSPCDAIVGSSGAIDGAQVYQVKGFPYSLDDLFCDRALVDAYRNGSYVTLRLTAGMYHRFHAPSDCWIEQVTYISGDTWNVNPIALRRIERLFCKNERAVLRARLAGSGHLITIVPVAAVLVASIRLHCLDVLLSLKHRGPNNFPCHAEHKRGQEMGWFQHGSTIILFAPAGFSMCPDVREGEIIRMGKPLMRVPENDAVSTP